MFLDHTLKKKYLKNGMVCKNISKKNLNLCFKKFNYINLNAFIIHKFKFMRWLFLNDQITYLFF